MNPDPERGGGQVLVDLALQGGGAHGAFTWGVLDRLLDEPWLRIEGISGTSAGAMNAAIHDPGAGQPRRSAPGTPRSAREILNRINEVSFNAPLLKELRMIAVSCKRRPIQDILRERVGQGCAFIASPAKS